jgi:polygalacturonase
MGPDLTRREWLGQMALGAAGIGPAVSAPPSAPVDGARVYNIRDFGAKGDGATLDTAAVQAAIDACPHDGGGTVLVPAGVFHVGSLELKSNVTLYLVASATLLGSADGKQYHAVDAIPLTGDSTLGDGNWALLYAVNATNVTIDGSGLIDGQGIQFHSPERGVEPPSGLGGNRRPYHLLVYRCEHLRVQNVRLLNSAYHSVRVIQCRYVQLHGLHINNRVNGNNDGFHFVSSEKVAVSDCILETQDDACALFGSCKYVTVTNCYFSTRWSVFRFGGGVAENITVSNCVLHQVFGCPFKFHGSPGSRFENISFSDLVLQDVTGPISISVGPSPRPDQSATAPQPERAPGIVRNISFSNIRGTVVADPPPLPGYPFSNSVRPGEIRSCIALSAIGDSIVENISFSDVHLTFGGGGTAEEGARRDIPEVAGEYFMLGRMPAYALYARNIRALTLSNVRFQVSVPDQRPAVILDHVTDAAITGLSVEGNPGAESVLRFIDTKQVLVTAARVLSPAATFLQLEGAGNERVTIDGGDLSNAARPLAFRDRATARAVTLRGQEG